jgi:hypothetical protein
MDPKGKGMVINDKEKESFINEPQTVALKATSSREMLPSKVA